MVECSNKFTFTSFGGSVVNFSIVVGFETLFQSLRGELAVTSVRVTRTGEGDSEVKGLTALRADVCRFDGAVGKGVM